MVYLLSSVNYTKVLSWDNNIDRTQYRRKLEFSGPFIIKQRIESFRMSFLPLHPIRSCNGKSLLVYQVSDTNCNIAKSRDRDDLPCPKPNQKNEPGIYLNSLWWLVVYIFDVYISFSVSLKVLFLIFFYYLNDTLRKVQNITMVKINLVFFSIFQQNLEITLRIHGLETGYVKLERTRS